MGRILVPTWNQFGVAYGQNFLGLNFNLSKIQRDMDYFVSVNVKNIRLALAGFDDTNNITYMQTIASEAHKRGLYVTYGLGAINITSANWPTIKAAWVSHALVMQNLGTIDLYILGNELEGNHDGSISTTTILNDIAAVATTIKNSGVTIPIGYSTGFSGEETWLSRGLAGMGGLDLLGLNQYDKITNFKYYVTHFNSVFGNRWYMSEFSAQHDFMYGPAGIVPYTEGQWAADIIERLKILKANLDYSQKAFLYSFDSGDNWNMRLSDGISYRQAWYSLLAKI